MFFSAGFFQAVPIQDMSFTTEEITQRGDLAIETGTNALTVGAPGQAGVTAAGKYLAVWKRQPNGRWLLWRHSPSSNVMAPR
jgi:ketosteroid isomerase-like protein